MNWRAHTEKPFDDAPVFTALIARQGDDGEFYLLESIHFWKDGEWIEEASGLRLGDQRPYWWMPESEVLELLKGANHDRGHREETGTTGDVGN